MDHGALHWRDTCKEGCRGIHLSVDLSYQVPPHIPTKYALYSKCSGDECPSQAMTWTGSGGKPLLA